MDLDVTNTAQTHLSYNGPRPGFTAMRRLIEPIFGELLQALPRAKTVWLEIRRGTDGYGMTSSCATRAAIREVMIDLDKFR